MRYLFRTTVIAVLATMAFIKFTGHSQGWLVASIDPRCEGDTTIASTFDLPPIDGKTLNYVSVLPVGAISAIFAAPRIDAATPEIAAVEDVRAVLPPAPSASLPVTAALAVPDRDPRPVIAALPPAPLGVPAARTPEAEAPSATLAEIRAGFLNLRAGPSPMTPVVAGATRGAKAEIVGRSGADWLQVRLIDTGETGWVLGRFVHPLEGV